MAEEVNDSIAQVLATHQDEQDEDEDETGDSKELEIRPHHAAKPVLKRGLRDDHNFLNGSGAVFPGGLEPGASSFAVTSSANFERRPAADCSLGWKYVLKLPLDIPLIVGKPIGQGSQLAADNVTDCTEA